MDAGRLLLFEYMLMKLGGFSHLITKLASRLSKVTPVVVGDAPSATGVIVGEYCGAANSCEE